MEPLVFLGCSTEALHLAQVVQFSLSSKALVQIWNQGFFPPGSYVMETLISKGDLFDFAILLFAADDVIEMRDKKMLVARDNTILEAGFFIGRLGRERTFIMLPKLSNLHLPTDFSGLTHVTYEANYPKDLEQVVISQSCFEIGTIINKLKKRRPFSEENISFGMINLLKVLHESQFCGSKYLGLELAKFNGSQPNKYSLPVWEKAVQYIMAYMSHLKLVKIQTITVAEYTLTEEGRDFVDNLPPYVGRALN